MVENQKQLVLKDFKNKAEDLLNECGQEELDIKYIELLIGYMNEDINALKKINEAMDIKG